MATYTRLLLKGQTPRARKSRTLIRLQPSPRPTAKRPSTSPSPAPLGTEEIERTRAPSCAVENTLKDQSRHLQPRVMALDLRLPNPRPQPLRRLSLKTINPTMKPLSVTERLRSSLPRTPQPASVDRRMKRRESGREETRELLKQWRRRDAVREAEFGWSS